MVVSKFSKLIGIALFAAASGAGSANAADGCADLPEVAMWGSTSHDKITDYVTQKYQGDWLVYIDNWYRQLKMMRNIQDNNGSAFFKTQGMTIHGKELDAYIKALEIRLDVTKCLARSAYASAAADTSVSIDTASGDTSPAIATQ